MAGCSRLRLASKAVEQLGVEGPDAVLEPRAVIEAALVGGALGVVTSRYTATGSSTQPISASVATGVGQPLIEPCGALFPPRAPTMGTWRRASRGRAVARQHERRPLRSKPR